MFTHIMVGCTNRDTAGAFYDAAFGALGMARMMPERMVYGVPGEPLFVVGEPRDGGPATGANGGTISFKAASKEAVDAFHAAGLANGGTDEGAPGVREQAPGKPYGAYLRDPSGNKIAAFAR